MCFFVVVCVNKGCGCFRFNGNSYGVVMSWDIELKSYMLVLVDNFGVLNVEFWMVWKRDVRLVCY